MTHPTFTPTARRSAAQALIRAAKAYPSLEAWAPEVGGLDVRDARLALAIYRQAMHRWLTAEYLLDKCLNKPMRMLQAQMRGILLSGAVQLLFFDRLPAYAVVDESVDLARALVNKNAGGLANAVLRKLAGALDHHEPQAAWTPAVDRLPLEQGVVVLKQPWLPDPAQLEKHLSVATSHPSALVHRWLELFGPEQTLELCRHGIQTPPTLVTVPPSPLTPSQPGGLSSPMTPSPLGPDITQYIPHATPGFAVWNGDHHSLTAYLAGGRDRRVQDPASAQAVAVARDLSPRLILDLCAGRGTKTRQLAQQFPDARIVAADPDAARRASLALVPRTYPQVTVTAPEQLDAALRGRRPDLILLDVPCSNTAVLARRPEARYRYRPATLDSLVELQRQIIAQALSLVIGATDVHILYATCSLEPAENRAQVDWLMQQRPATLVREESGPPGGTDATYHDGFYAALVRLG